MIKQWQQRGVCLWVSMFCTRECWNFLSRTERFLQNLTKWWNIILKKFSLVGSRTFQHSYISQSNWLKKKTIFHFIDIPRNNPLQLWLCKVSGFVNNFGLLYRYICTRKLDFQNHGIGEFHPSLWPSFWWINSRCSWYVT